MLCSFAIKTSNTRMKNSNENSSFVKNPKLQKLQIDKVDLKKVKGGEDSSSDIIIDDFLNG